MRITLTARISHGILYEAAKRLEVDGYGGFRKLAERLGLHYGTVLRLRDLTPPSEKWVALHGLRMSIVLSEILGRGVSIEEVFPEAYVKHGQKIPNKIETSQDLPIDRLLASAGRPMLRSGDERVMDSERSQALKLVMKTLTPREEQILSMHFGLGEDEPVTLEEIGRKLSVCKERVRALEDRALRKLRNPARAKRLKPFIGS